MKVLSIGTDRKLFEDGSEVLSRSILYSSKMEELHIIVFTLKKQKFTKKNIGNLYIYPTNSFSKLSYIFDAIRIGKNTIRSSIFNIQNSKKFIITSQDPFETGFVGYQLKKIFNLPLQVQVHTDFLSKKFKKSYLNKVRLFICKKVIPSADSIRVVSSEIKSSIENKFFKITKNIDVLPIYIDIEKILNTAPTTNLKSLFPQFQSIVLMASRLEKEKRIDVALESIKKVFSMNTSVGLVIAGDGREKENLLNKAKYLGISNNVVFLGWQKDLISLYKTADIFLLTSEYEGYGMTLVEAGASGCPIVTTKVGLADTDLFKNGENSFVCLVDDINCIENSILNLINSKERQELFKHRMQDSIKNISLSKNDYVSRYVNLLEKLIK